jgi:hypothetical protein
MTTRRLSAFIDALVAGRRPRSFQADPEDAEMLRVAIALRAARPGDSMPDEEFVAQLHDQLADTLSPSERTNIHPLRVHRARVALISVAAGLALVGGTAAVTEISNSPTVQQSATQVPHGNALRTATFETSTGQVLGQIVVYHGQPSWVYMNVNVPHSSNGTVECELHLANGEVVAAGTVSLHDGSGELSKSIHMDAGQVQGATLFDPSGAVVASATFA